MKPVALPRQPLDFLLHFARAHARMFMPMALCELLHATCGVLGPYLLADILRAAAPGSPPERLIHSVVSFAALAAAEIIFGRAAGALQLRLAPIQRQAALRALYAWLQGHSHRYLSNNFAGALAHRLSETSLAVNQILWALIFDLMPVLVTLSVSTLLLARTEALLGWMVGLWSCAYLGASWWLARSSQAFTLAAAAARAETTGSLVDSVSHLSSAHLFAQLTHERRVLDSALQRELLAIRQSNTYTERIRWTQAIAFAVLKLGTLAYATWLWRHNGIRVADFVLVVTLGLLILNEARNLGRRFLELFEYSGNLNNGLRTLLVPHEIVDAPNAQPLQVSTGRIEFDRVCFAYQADQPVFENLSVTLHGGQRVGLVGYSGSGKSTFVNLLLRLYEVQGGAIRIDGQDIRQVPQEDLHAKLGLIPQDPSLFHRSLADNIRYGRQDASEQEVRAAAGLAHADRFIERLRDGYASLVGERGVKLSGGQRQRVAIARALLKDAPLLVLDEATSSLDSITERTIQETLDKRLAGKTVIVIAHRLSTVAHLDRLLVFENGQIVQDGTHAELICVAGLYQRLWQMQADGFLGDAGGIARTSEDGVPEAAEVDIAAIPQP